MSFWMILQHSLSYCCCHPSFTTMDRKDRLQQLVKHMKGYVRKLLKNLFSNNSKRGLYSSKSLEFHKLFAYVLVGLMVMLEGEFLVKDSDLVCRDQSTGEIIPRNWLYICQMHQYPPPASEHSGVQEAVTPIYRFFTIAFLVIWGLLQLLDMLKNFLENKFLDYIFTTNDQEEKHKYKNIFLQNSDEDESEDSDSDSETDLSNLPLLPHLPDNVWCCSNSVYQYLLLLHVLALLLDLFILLTMDFLLQNHSLQVILAYPWFRNFTDFSHIMNQLFPAFVRCDVDLESYILGLGVRNFGCYNPATIVYEKLFSLIAILVFLLTTLTLAQLLYFVFLLRWWEAKKLVPQDNGSVTARLTRGQIVLLLYFKTEMDVKVFYQDLMKILEQEDDELAVIS